MKKTIVFGLIFLLVAGVIGITLSCEGPAGPEGKAAAAPHIGENGNWWIGDEDTGVSAQGTPGNDGNNGDTPYIGDNGNWWIGDEDTGVPAQGDPGSGGNGNTPYIGDNGNWWVGGEDTGVPAQGNSGSGGDTPHIGDNGNWWVGDEDTGVPVHGNSGNGSNGKDGDTPYIGDNGNWWIGDEDTGYSVEGPTYMFLPPAGNPIITSIYTADPSAHVWPTDPNRLYLYPSTDVFPARGCNMMDQYHVFSTDNMLDWIDHGEILRRDDLPVNTWGPHHTDAYFMWAPDAAYNPNVPGKGPYFFYFPHATGTDGSGAGSWGQTWKFGVAWSDSPYKGFKDEVVMLKDKNGNVINGGGELIDPCIFQDGDDYYLATGGSQQFRIAKLSADMVSLAEDFHVYNQTQLPYYHEGPWMFTRKNAAGTKVYYLMYPGKPAGGNGSDDLLYAISADPYGPWQYMGSILGQVNTGDTSHGSIVEFKGKWYIFYHNAVLSKGAGNLRSVCVDELIFNPNGTIRKAAQTETSVTPRGPEATAAALDSKFGAGEWTIEPKYYPGFGEILMIDYIKNARYTVGRTNANGDYLNASGAVTTQNNQKVANPDVTVAGGTGQNPARIETNKNYPQTQGLDSPGSYVQFANVSGGTKAGKAVVEVEYGRGTTDATSVQVIVSPGANQKSYQINCPKTDSWEDPPFGSAMCQIDLAAGNNTIRFSSGAINIVSITIYLAR